jgi:hypothetical protein
MVVPSPTPTIKSFCKYFPKKMDTHTWQCKKCLKTKSKSSGWTNLLSHLHLCVGKDYEQAFVDHQILIASTLTAAGYFLQISKHEKEMFTLTAAGYCLQISEREKEMFNWINFNAVKNLPENLWIAGTLATSQD